MKPALIKYSEDSEVSPPSARLPKAVANNRQIVTTNNPTLLMNPLPAYPWNSTCKGLSAELLRSPCNTSPEGAAHNGGCGVDKLRDKFNVLVIQQVLPAKRELQFCNGFPVNLSIQGVVAGYIET